MFLTWESTHLVKTTQILVTLHFINLFIITLLVYLKTQFIIKQLELIK